MPALNLKPLLFVSAIALCLPAVARTVTVPITLNYQLIQTVTKSQLFGSQQQSIDLYADPTRCNALTLIDPVISGTADGQLVLEAGLSAKGGSPLGGSCLPLFAWSGTVRTQQQPFVRESGMALGFHVTDIHLEPSDLEQPPMPAMLEGWVTAFVSPALETLAFDLEPAMTATRGLLYQAIPGGEKDIDTIADSIALADIHGDSDNLVVTLKLDLPEAWDLASASTETLNDQELASWDSTWQAWDAFATWLIKDLAIQVGLDNPELTRTLADSLMEARYDLRLALTENNQQQDPVRELFLKTWDRLTPLLQSELSRAPGLEDAKYLSFISAVDALMAIDQVAEGFAVRFDSATLRALARLVNPAVTDDELNYSTEVDPELRKLLGLDAEFEGSFNDTFVWPSPLAMLIPRAEAATIDPALSKKLHRWVPGSSDIDDYLATVQQLLEFVANKELEKGKVPERFFPVYESLLMATAWQESCWRQYVSDKGQVTPLKSSAGSVGMMQVNQHVWRGVYDVNSLVNDMAYNARAGNEILVHYLVDYAIKKKENEAGGGADALARSTYAMYNGGPGHIARYRKDTTGQYLKKIDGAFFSKYRDIKSRGATAVKSCYIS